MSENKDEQNEHTRNPSLLNFITENNDKKKEKEGNIPKDNLDISTNTLKKEDINNNNILNKLNNNNNNISNDQNNNPNKQKANLYQRAKTWIGNMWTSIKSYDYSKYNIFKKEEMEDCLDAHGNHIKIPKKKHSKKINQEDKKVDKKEVKLNYPIYNSINMNVYSGYPF